MAQFTESVVEEAALDWLRELGYTVVAGPEALPGEGGPFRETYADTLLAGVLKSALARFNVDLPSETLDDAFRRLTRPPGATLQERNRGVHQMLVDGVTVEYRRPDGSIAGAQARVIDFDTPDNNDWLAVNQFTVAENLPAATGLSARQAGAAQAGKHTRRPDVVLFINGLPLAVLELKNAADENATIWTAFQQLQTYQQEIPSLFAYNAALVVSDGV